jgi:hypothetical protein
VPSDEAYDAVLIDTWAMTRALIARGVVRGLLL